MNTWLATAADALATATGVPREQLDLTDAETEALLNFAGYAAHASGDRTNAPLLCYLAGRAAERSGRSVLEIATAVSGE